MELFGAAFIRSMTPSNICFGFKAAGIYPFNCDVFSEELYLCSLVTDHPKPVEMEKNESINDDEKINVDIDRNFNAGVEYRTRLVVID